MNLNDPLTRAVTETLVVAAATLLMLFVVASYVQNVFGMVDRFGRRGRRVPDRGAPREEADGGLWLS